MKGHKAACGCVARDGHWVTVCAEHRTEDDKWIAARAAEIEDLKFTVRRLTQTISRAVDDLETVGNDYPGSSCQQWCSERAAAAWAQIAGTEAALAPAEQPKEGTL